jgi:hypothetical protein
MEAAARALKYARVAGSLSYDEIGFRSLAATPTKGYFPLQTFAQARLDKERDARRLLPPEWAALFEQARKLRHRPLAVPEGHVSYTVDSDMIHFRPRRESGDDDGIMWSFPLGAPPKELLNAAYDSDMPLLLAQRAVRDPANARRLYWLPLLVLIESSRFGRMQQCRGELVSKILSGRLYCFISHRWLSPTVPDPDGTQARLAAWQLVSAMCEAVYVAQERGLHVPRRKLSFVSPIGPSGSDLAESLIVNVLRYAMDATSLAAVHAEILPLQQVTSDNGVQTAHTDVDLVRLRELVGGHPRLKALLERVHVWYDYSCLPQKPRTAEEQGEFEWSVRHLELYQFLGRTAILLDEADDYLTRAWCTLEVLTADVAGTFDVLVGAARPTVAKGATEHYLSMLVADRPHVVWRAVLDTEVFRVQTSAECMRRLELMTTEEPDLPIVSAALRRLGAPRKIHNDDSEVVTGTFPLPIVDRGRAVLLPMTSEWKTEPTQRLVGSSILDWTGALLLDSDRSQDMPETASCLRLGHFRRRSCHVVVIGSCEGEAVLISNWALARAVELERAVGASVCSLTWLATDVAPVGHFAEGTLRTTMIDAPLWVLVSINSRFDVCAMTHAVTNAVLAAGLPFVTVALDSSQDNLKRYTPPGHGDLDTVMRVETRQARMAEWRGGLFSAHVFSELRRAVAGISDAWL